ncbi:hypothetical protein B0H15DRAFT_1020536 [Mycena belliarum]|uniref:DUF6534 domain-containing protein n=1 Tax=Mycena belliarum TaxID=1033014 RepID=A0AAD6XRA3_9AGAR|nr:hypothetical protein B0H15DRAFT_1020536 [Mycena belliae]
MCPVSPPVMSSMSPAGATPVPDPQVVAAAIATAKEVFATSFIGFAVATTAYGIGVLQCYLYFRSYPKDSIYLKFTVGTLWILDTLSTIMVAHSLYTYFVLNFGDLAADALIPWSFALENGLLTLVTIIAQCFYAWQIWTVSMNIFVTGGILALAFACLGLGLWITVHLFRFPAGATLATHKFQSISGPVQGTAAACDITITVALIFYLRSKRRAGIRTTEHMIDTLILYAVCRGILTAITQIMFLVLNVGFPTRTFWQPFHQVVGKLYVNSIVASLNVRKVVRGKGNPEKSSRLGTSGSTARTDSTVFDIHFFLLSRFIHYDNQRTMPLTFMPKSQIEDRLERPSEEDHVEEHSSVHRAHIDNKTNILPHAL